MTAHQKNATTKVLLAIKGAVVLALFAAVAVFLWIAVNPAGGAS